MSVSLASATTQASRTLTLHLQAPAAQEQEEQEQVEFPQPPILKIPGLWFGGLLVVVIVIEVGDVDVVTDVDLSTEERGAYMSFLPTPHPTSRVSDLCLAKRWVTKNNPGSSNHSPTSYEVFVPFPHNARKQHMIDMWVGLAMATACGYMWWR